MSSSFESGGRYRPVDVSVDDSDDIPLDGTRLKQERIERGMSVNDAARMARRLLKPEALSVVVAGRPVR